MLAIKSWPEGSTLIHLFPSLFFVVLALVLPSDWHGLGGDSLWKWDIGGMHECMDVSLSP
jgi:hypothetical protein